MTPTPPPFSRNSWRELFVAASLLLGLTIVLTTELLNLVGGINSFAVRSLWCLLSLVAIFAAYRWSKRGVVPPLPTIASVPPLSRLLLAAICVYVIGTAAIAVIAPPNTWDSMEYHMSKVAHWIQNESVAFYPTAIPRQNHLSPGSEYAVLHLHLLAGSDRLVNLVQWYAMAGSLVVVSLIARELGAPAFGQIIAAAFAASLPMGILQASGTQTDYVAAFWFCCFIFCFLRSFRIGLSAWPNTLMLGAALGLAAFTKGTNYVYAFPFLVWLVWSAVRTHRWKVAAPFVAIAAIFLTLNSGHYARNLSLYGHPLGPREEPMANTRYFVGSAEPAVLVSNSTKHLAAHVTTPWPNFNREVLQHFKRFHQMLGIDLADPRTSWGPRSRFSIRTIRFHEESDGNPIHFVLGIIGLAVVVLVPSLRRRPKLLPYAAVVATGLLLFSACLKWHPWMSRLHLPVFIAFAPVAGVILSVHRRQWIGGAICGALLVVGLPWLVYCQQRPLLGKPNLFTLTRDQLYFKTPYQTYEDSFLKTFALLRERGVNRLGLIVDNSSWEYPWWVFLRRDNPDFRIEHVNTTDASKVYYERPPYRGFVPEAVVMLDQAHPPETVTVNGQLYPRHWQQDKVALYVATHSRQDGEQERAQGSLSAQPPAGSGAQAGK